MRCSSSNRYLICTWLATGKKGNGLAVGEELERGLESGVAAADDCYVLVGKKRAVAARAIGEALLVVFCRAGYLEPAAACAGSDEESLALQYSAVLQRYGHLIVGRCERFGSRG